MIAIDNTALLAMNGCNCVGFAPAVTYAYNSGTKALTVTDASVFGAGDAFKRLNVEAFDEEGNSAKGTIAAAGGNVVLSLTPLANAKPMHIKATLSSTGGCVSDGSIRNIVASGSLANWDRDFTSSEAPNIAAPGTITV